VLPGAGEDNLGREFGLSGEALSLAAHMDSAAVREKFRGFGLQRRLMEAAEQALAGRGIRYLFCTAHPENLYSQNNIRGLGYEAFQRKKMYGGRMRDLFVKRIPPEGCGKDAANLFSTEDKE
ncbi:MAG TPA: GNAT family N-acetyltransferase, partial [Candidatus Enterocloster excrementipullorum]|nr:GNAT family N-acetyltransferase [Candidatus Enterocloster excrementipullorum]